MKQNEVIDLLKSYLVCKRYLDSQAYAKEHFNPDDTQKIDEKEIYEARIHTIESLMQLLAPSDEYTVLRLHYAKGVPVEKCAECMGVSARTAYRMLNKGHKAICDLVSGKERATDERPKAD